MGSFTPFPPVLTLKSENPFTPEKEITLYLRRIAQRNAYHYILRETYRNNGDWTYRDLIDLGPDPAQYIGYPGGYAFHIRSELEQALRSARVEYTREELAELLIPFLHPALRWVFEHSQTAYFPYTLSRACSIDELSGYQEEIHPFDVRRLHYLKFGQIDMGRVEMSRSWRFLRILSCKCRDEIEATFEAMEQDLTGGELSSYIYTALHLQKHFPYHSLRNYPAGLDLDEIDARFLEEICRLNNDELFFRGVEGRDGKTLHSYLSKYVWLYFDHELEVESPWEWFMRELLERQRFYRESRQYYRPSRVEPSISVTEACAILEISNERFSVMSRRELIRIYRRKAKEKHPDKGGDHDAFVRLGAAYEILLAAKG
jgi:hypothetical protein